jgi:hypothetical protein
VAPIQQTLELPAPVLPVSTGPGETSRQHIQRDMTGEERRTGDFMVGRRTPERSWVYYLLFTILNNPVQSYKSQEVNKNAEKKPEYCLLPLKAARIVLPNCNNISLSLDLRS